MYNVFKFFYCKEALKDIDLLLGYKGVKDG